MRKIISKAFIDAVFESSEHQAEVVSKLYRFVFPDWDDIEKINGFPTIGDEANEYIFKKFFEFDRKHHPEVFSGGAWLNHGFSSLEAKSIGLGPWEVSDEGCSVIRKDPIDSFIRRRPGCRLNCGD